MNKERKDHEEAIKDLRQWLRHQDKDCPLVARRIHCIQCGYPLEEANWPSVGKYLEYLR
jgi:hypothetical protein